MIVTEVKNISKSFKVKQKKVEVLKGLSFEIKKGEILGFLGPNGAGKSTTIKVMLDLIRADRGEVNILGIPSTDFKSRRKIGFMPENPQYYDNLTGLDLLMLTASVYKMDKEKSYKKAWELLEKFELKESGKKQIRKYSKGMIQRIGFASSIIHDPDILILDEPMSGLDPVGRVLFKNVMKELNKNGTTIFFSSHIIPDIEEICSRVIMIKAGQVVKELDNLEIKHLSTYGFQIVFKRSDNLPTNFTPQLLSNDLMSITVNKNELSNMIDTLKSHSIEIVDIAPIKHSLEDIFMQLL
jgi:ABC-2 type transport system ATP-binding protein